MTSTTADTSRQNYAVRPNRLIDGMSDVADALLAVAMVVELALVLGNIFARHYLQHSFLWADEVARIALTVLAFIGGAVAYRRRDHASVRIVLSRLPAPAERILIVLADVVVLGTAVLVGLASLEFISSSWYEITPILQLPAAVIAMPLPIGMVLLAIYAVINLRAHGVVSLAVGGVVAVLLLTATLASDLWLPLDGEAPLIAALALFFFAILAGIPVGFVLLLATSAYLWFIDAPSMVVVPHNMVNGTGNFILLAVPFFIFAGLIMERGGISERLVQFIYTLVGHMRGGLLQVTVASMYVVSGLSGSKPADVAAVGTVMRDKITERHGAAEGAAVLAATAIMGETIPPSIAMLIVGSITNVSVAAMFVGGMLPAAVMAICLMLMIWYRARRDGSPTTPRPPAREIANACLHAVLPLSMPGMLLGGILFGVATPTEVAAAAVLYGLLLGAFVYRRMNWETFKRTIVDASALTGVLLFIFATASAFSWTLTVASLPQRLVALLHAVGGGNEVFMIGSILLLVVVGVLLEGLPSLNVLAPLLIPIAGKLGLNEVHYALVLIITMGIGGFMPLVGVGFYVCCAIMRCDIESASKAMLPYLAVIVTGLLIVAFVPWFSLVLPRLFGFM
jgi:tripartite ATP-independent transporter DctM subunit